MASTATPAAICIKVEVATRTIPCLLATLFVTSGRFVKALAIDAITAAVPASSGAILPLAVRLAAAAVALALLASALNAVAHELSRYA
jgi:hypothetical protein